MKNPKATTAAILEREGKLLITRRAIEPFKGQWVIPGGHIDPDEKVQDAILREVKEEVGLEFKPEFFGYYDEIFPEIGWHAACLVFSGKPEGEVEHDKSEVSEWKWATQEDLESLELGFVNKQIFKDWFKSKKGGSA